MHTYDLCFTAVPIDKPVIIGIPPDSTSPHAYGRRKFLDKNLNEDRRGPPCLKASVTSKVQKAGGRTSKKESSTSSKKVKAEDGFDTPMRQLDNASDGEVPDEDAKPKTKKKKPTSKAKPEVQFVVVDEPADPPYDSSQEGSAQYSCPEDDMPITHSPHLLRNKCKRNQMKQGMWSA